MKNVSRKRYNVLYTTSFGYMMGGGQWSLYYLIKHLNKDLFKPIVLCPEIGELAEKIRGLGADVVYLNIGRIRYLNIFVIKRLISIIKERQIDIIHTDSTTETFYAGIAAKFIRIPLIWHIRVSEGGWFLDWILSLFSTKLMLVADALKSRFSWLNEQKMVTVYNGVDIEEFDAFRISPIRREFGIEEDTVLLGCIGRIEERKGQEYLIKATRHVDKAKVIFIGSDEEKYLKRLQSLCEEFKVSDRVIFAGHREDIPSLLKEIDILVFPVVTGEGFSRVILEAMAASKPVIATNDAGNPEAVANGVTGYIVPAKDIMALAERINELAGDKEKRDQMGKAGRKRLENLFTIKNNVKETEKVYLEVLKKNHD